MTKTIQAGHHYPGWDINLPWIGTQSMTRYVRFHDNCAYDSAPYNSQDVNKLFGLSFGLLGVHHNSARFGWRWSNSDQCIELLAYVYKDGVRNWDEQLRFPVIARVQPNVGLILEVSYNELTQAYDFWVTGPAKHIMRPTSISAPANLLSYGLTHNFYFGGELAAPHTMSVDISRNSF